MKQSLLDRSEEVRPGRRLHLVVNAESGVNDEDTVTLFFIHGAMGSTEQFRFQFQNFMTSSATATFPRKCNIVAFDALGCGHSEKPRDYAAYATDELFTDLRIMFMKFKQAGKRNYLIG
jgi:pimeloyl-ACP methyl ester carboxylesterase